MRLTEKQEENKDRFLRIVIGMPLPVHPQINVGRLIEKLIC